MHEKYSIHASFEFSLFHFVYFIFFALTASATSSFHHHVSLCLQGPFHIHHICCGVSIIIFFILCKCSFTSRQLIPLLTNRDISLIRRGRLEEAVVCEVVCYTEVRPGLLGKTRSSPSADRTAFRYHGNGATPDNILIPLERQLIALQLCRLQFLGDRL